MNHFNKVSELKQIRQLGRDHYLNDDICEDAKEDDQLETEFYM